MASIDRLNKFFTDFRTSKLGIVVFYGYLIAVLIGGLFIAKVISDNRHTADQVLRALCVEKLQAQQGVRLGVQFLREHPHGTTDFPREFIVSSITRSREQVKAFNDLACG